MKNIIFVIAFVLISIISFGQGKNQRYGNNQWNGVQWLEDSVRMGGLFGSGTVLRIDVNGYLYKASGTSVDTINISQVLGLQDSLAKFQENLTLDSNFVFQGDTFIQLNDTIWVEVGRFIDEVQIVNSAPRIYMQDNNAPANNKDIQMTLETGELRVQYLNDAGSGSGDYALFNRSGNNMLDFSLYDNAATTIQLKNSGTGVFEDTVRSGQLKVAGILYPLTDGTDGQVVRTNGGGVLSFANAGSLLTGGTDITISNDTISYTGSAGTNYWTKKDNAIYNNIDTVVIGDSVGSYPLHVKKQMKIENSSNPSLIVENGSFSTPAISVISSIGAGIEISSNPNFGGYALKINSVDVDSISTDTLLASSSNMHLPTEYAVKKYVDYENVHQKLGDLFDVDTSARVDGFVIKWNSGTREHYYDTAGTGGGGSTYFAGDGLSLAANVFSIGTDSVKRYMIQDTAISYAKIQRVSPHSVLARVAGTDGSLSEVSLGTSQLLGRGSSGNIAPITLGSGLTMSGTTLSSSASGTVTSVQAGNGMNFSTITGSGTVTMGTPTTLTGSSTNATTSTSHTHALDFGTFKSNSYGFFLDTTRMAETDSAVTITTEEKVILFTMSENVDSVLLGSGYFTMSARVVINAVNNDTLSGTVALGGNLPKYTIKAYLVDETQTLGSVISGSKTELRTARVIDMFGQYKEGEGTADGTLTMTMNTNPTKFRITDGFFVAVTISATYGGVTDYVKHEDASMVIEKANDYDENREQIFD